MKGTYEIQDYAVTTLEGNEQRQMIVYYNKAGKEETRELYYPGYVFYVGYLERSSIIAEQQDEE